MGISKRYGKGLYRRNGNQKLDGHSRKWLGLELGLVVSDSKQGEAIYVLV